MSEFGDHLRVCAHCRAHPFALCEAGPNYDSGYADAIADVVAMLHGIGRTEACTIEALEFADRIKARIERGDAKGARHG